MKKIAIFASGRGSNALRIIEYFSTKQDLRVDLLVSNKKKAGVLDIAKSWNIDQYLVTRDESNDPQVLITVLLNRKIDLIVLAGYLWLIPKALIRAFPNRIVNIHPALLPKYGGKGMYGQYVHQAVKEAGDTESGISIHYVNERYDEGAIIFQVSCPIEKNDSPEEIARKVLILEHKYYPQVIAHLLNNLPDPDAIVPETAN